MPETNLEIWDDDVLAGSARLHPTGKGDRAGMEVEFTYDRNFLSSSRARQIDPVFNLYEGIHVASATPGCFADATPDAWGRFLIRNALRQARSTREPDAVDYLLNVSDTARQGSVRFRVNGRFLRDDMTIPHHVDLAVLARTALEAERTGDPGLVSELFDSGAQSTGGAVTKATVADQDGALWIAKFYPGDTGRWEKVAFELAARAGLDVPDTQLTEAGAGSVFLSRRFDRRGGRRVPYLSAASLLVRDSWGAADYADLADVVRDHGAAPVDNLRQLWQRMAFLAAVNSTDDHLRNHGFVWEAGGWRLSRMFDVVPTDSLERKTSINGALERDAMVDSLTECAGYFEIDNPRAELGRIWAVTSQWRDVARVHGLDTDAIERKAVAFEYLRPQVEKVSSATSFSVGTTATDPG